MNFLLITPYYLKWHYSKAIFSIFEIWKNLMWFLWNFFSIKILLKTFFSPFERLKEKYSGGLDIENFMSAMIVNLIMRLIGIVIRTTIIIFGLLVCIFFVILGIFGFIIWFFLPLILVYIFIISLIPLIK